MEIPEDHVYIGDDVHVGWDDAVQYHLVIYTGAMHMRGLKPVYLDPQVRENLLAFLKETEGS